MSFVFALSTTLLLVVMLLKGDTRQNFATWLMWGILDAIVALSIYSRGGNYLLVTLYTVTSLLISACIYYRFGFSWTIYETKVAWLACVCMLVWYLTGSWYAIIASTFAVIIAGDPQVRDIWTDTDNQKAWSWIGFGIANFFGILMGKEWSVAERFYPTCCFLFSVVLVWKILISSRKPFWHRVF